MREKKAATVKNKNMLPWAVKIYFLENPGFDLGTSNFSLNFPDNIKEIYIYTYIHKLYLSWNFRVA